ncbi:hypothetical protein [Nostoc cycadae]|nr:hypothetical protein [Nostoc cycadae]
MTASGSDGFILTSSWKQGVGANIFDIWLRDNLYSLLLKSTSECAECTI